MKEKILFFSIKHPLSFILVTAVILKVAAAILTEGYIYDNDYFNYFNVPESWLGKWWVVLMMRFAVSAFSLFIITIGYRIVKIISDKKTALEVATVLAFMWFMPYITAHPLPQMIIIPFILYGTLLIVKQVSLLNNKEIEKIHRTTFIIAGLCFGLGFTFWYQSILYYIGIVIALLILRNWKGSLMTIIGFVVAICFTETIPDLIIYGKPFVRIAGFFNNSCAYIFSKGFEYQYCYQNLPIDVIGFLAPLSFMIIFGYFRVCRKYLVLFMPVLLFMLFYTIFPNFNGAYLLPAIPTYVICGFVGWKEFKRKSVFWEKNRKLLLCLNVLTVTINAVLLVITFIERFKIV